MLVSWDSNSAKGKCTVLMLDKPLIEKGIQQHTVWTIWVLFEKQGSRCFASKTDNQPGYSICHWNHPVKELVMKCLIITDLNNCAYQFIFNCLETSSVKWDSNPNMGACELSFLWTNCTINIIIQLCNRNLHVGELGFKLSQRVVYSSCWTKLWLKKAFSNIQYELWVWFEKQGSQCFASLLWYWQSVP